MRVFIIILLTLVLISSVSAVNMIEIENVKISENNKAEQTFQDEDYMSSIMPETDLDIKVIVKNLYNTTQDNNLKKVKVTATIKDILNGDDLVEESGTHTIISDEVEEITLSMTIPRKVSEGRFDFDFDVTSKDENDSSHSDDLDIKLEIEKVPHLMVLNEINFSENPVSCDTEKVNVNLNITNMGGEDETVLLTVENAELGYSKSENVYFDSDPYTSSNEQIVTFEIPIAKEDRKDAYNVFVSGVYATNHVIKQTFATLNADTSCASEETTTQTDNQTAQTTPPRENTTVTNTTTQNTTSETSNEINTNNMETTYTAPINTETKEFNVKTLAIVLLVLGAALAILIIVLAITKRKV